MKPNAESKDTIEKIRLFSGSTYEQSKDFFESLVTYLVYNYLEGNSTYIPFFGSVKVNYEGDIVDAKGKEAVLSLDFEADSSLKKIIGQIVDGEETEVEKILKKKIRIELEETADPEIVFKRNKE